MIKTSVIIPVYNTAPYLEECIDSVFKQTQKEKEVIVINDGSTDNSWEVLLRMKKKYPKLILLNQENQGLGYTRNIGIERARGKYIYFLDSDDYISKDTLEICYEYASENRLDLVLFDAFNFEDSDERKPVYPNLDDRQDVILEREEVFSGIFFLDKYHHKIYEPAVWLVYCSAEFLKKNNIRFLPRVYFEDNEFHCRIMTLADRVMYIPKLFYQRRCRNNSIMGSEFDLRKAKDLIKVVLAIAELKDLKGGQGWSVIREIDLSLLMYVASICNKNKLYRHEEQLSRWILDAEIMILGHDIDAVENTEDICHMYNLCAYFPEADLCKEKQCISNRKNILLTAIFNQLPLNQSTKKVAIYGCGKYTDKVLKFYKRCMGKILAEVVFLDSFASDNNKEYDGFPVRNVKKIGEEQFDSVLISSPQYENEMKNTIQQLYNDRFPLILLHGELNINV